MDWRRTSRFKTNCPGNTLAMPWWIWVIAGIAALAIEVQHTRDFTLFCVGASALLVGIMAWLGVSDVRVQLLVLVVLSGASVLWARDWLVGLLAHGPSEDDLSNVVGQVAIPEDDLPPFGFGKAELRGTTWSAHNATAVAILRGQRCRVMSLRGLTLWIMPE